MFSPLPISRLFVYYAGTMYRNKAHDCTSLILQAINQELKYQNFAYQPEALFILFRVDAHPRVPRVLHCSCINVAAARAFSGLIGPRRAGLSIKVLSPHLRVALWRLSS